LRSWDMNAIGDACKFIIMDLPRIKFAGIKIPVVNS